MIEDGGFSHLFPARDGEVIVVSRRGGEHVYYRGDDKIGVTLKAGIPTVVEALAARQLVGDVEIVDELRGELPIRTRLMPRERGWWVEEEVVASWAR